MGRALNSYQAKRASNLSNPTSATCFKQADDATKPAFVHLPLGQVMPAAASASIAFHIFARGRATTGTTSNFKATVQYNSDLSQGGVVSAATAANNTDFFALTNRSLATITRPWYIDLIVVWDSTSQRLSGQSNGFNAETIETANASITALTSIDLSTEKPGFVVSALFGSTNASNVATLDDFYCEVL